MDRFDVPGAACHIIVLQQVIDSRSAFFYGEDLGELGSGQAVVGVKGSVAIAAHQIISQHIVHRPVIPCTHTPQGGEAIRRAIHTAATGRTVQQGGEGGFYRYGSAGHTLAERVGQAVKPLVPALEN